ncbi:uncharacterized protein PV09_04998 [Verruconis gallopava]|uniref:Cutinase n=1 Tax=Verruconis gallopava TaxID=253628 RepID=A0A0D1YSR3_9PEZI|nr:uncharacterized protein PV09_04998 [Verruconis gallopava]KIW03677.1 hypothetical protein PV09_04998 [Verruconis gallopava]
MKNFLLILALNVLALAAPVVQEHKRQITDNEFLDGPCRDIILFFVRGTFELGNMGLIVGPPLSAGLKNNFGDDRVATQGVDYAAGVATNFLPDNADPVGVANMQNLFNEAATRCPNSVVVAGGYSQGAAITHAAIAGLSDSVKSQIVGVTLFGDTRNEQDHGSIEGYPQDDLLIICNPGDLVCDGTLIITPAHLLYTPRVPEAVAFLTEKINAAGV